jgi:hypothetical protein
MGAFGCALRTFAVRKSPVAWLSFWSLGSIERMKIRRIILIVGLLVVVAAYVSWLLISRWQHEQTFKSLPKLAAAMRSYSHDQISHGRPVPSSVTVQDLVSGGYISAGEVRDLGGADVTFYPTVSESDPQAVLVRVRMSDGSQIVALADGSVGSVSR